MPALATPTPYFMEDAREAQRLTDKVDVKAWVDQYLAPYLPAVGPILDVGCGPGVLLEEMTRRAGVRGVGLDASPSRLEHARSRYRGHSIEFQQGDATALPFADATFQLVTCRFLLEYLSRKELAIQEMARVCQSGGRVVLQDLDGQLVWHYPFPEDLRRQTEVVLAALGESGFDIYAGRKLYTLARRAGLTDLAVRIDPYHHFAGAIDDHNLRLWQLKLEIARPVINDALGDVDAADRFVQSFLALLQSPDSLTYSVLFTVTGTVP